MSWAFSGDTGSDPAGWYATLALSGTLASITRMFDLHGDTLVIDGDALTIQANNARNDNYA